MAKGPMEWLFGYLSSLSPTWVYLTLTGVLLLCGLGVPIPEDISLISAGYVAHLGVISVHKAFVVCLLAVLGGDTIAFFLGRNFGHRVIESRFSRRFFTPRKQLRVRAYFRKYGSKVIFIGRFLPGLRFSIFFSAGTLRVKPAVFIIYDGLAAMLSVPFLVYLAWYFGDDIDQMARWAQRSQYGIVAVAVVVVAVVVIKARRSRRLRRKSRGVPTGMPPVLPQG